MAFIEIKIFSNSILLEPIPKDIKKQLLGPVSNL